MINVLLDFQIFRRAQSGGIRRYFDELMNESKHLNDIEISISALRRRQSTPGPLRLRGANRILLPIDLVGSLLAPSRDADVFHSTYYGSLGLASRPSIPHVVTIHDCIPEDFPALFSSTDAIEAKQEYVKDADAIICPSANTAERLAAHYPFVQHKTFIVPHGTRLNEYKSFVPNAIVPKGRFLIYIGNRTSGHKNIESVYAAFARTRVSGERPHLVLFGGGSRRPEEQILFERLGIQDRVLNVSGSDEILTAHLANAEALVVPSLAEGFSLPVIEALSMGCSVIANDIPVLREVGGPFPMFVNASNIEALREAFELVFSKHFWSLKDREAATEYARAFSWKATLKSTIEVYKSVIKGA